MSDNKRYYWIKTRTDFFDSDKIRQILSLEKGFEYFTLYSMLRGKCANRNGEICIVSETGKRPYTMRELLVDTQLFFSEETIKEALGILEKEKLLEKTEDGIYRFSDFDTMVGEESVTKDALRKREYRRRQKEMSDNMSDEIGGNNTGQIMGQCPTEIDIEKDKEIDIDKDIDIDIDIDKETESEKEKDTEKEKEKYKEKDEKDDEGSADALFVSEIISYLNLRAGTDFGTKNKDTRRYIRARLAEGYSVEDFKTVIDKRVSDWLGTKMQKYLRPQTLFGNKFEGYLNERVGTDPYKEGKSNPYFDIAQDIAASENGINVNVYEKGVNYEVE